jgi:pyruvate dehydrogenase phosphatase
VSTHVIGLLEAAAHALDACESLSQAFLAEKPLRPPPSNFKTPPYVTATPVVTHRKLDVPPLTSSTAESTDTKLSLRFLVLATDGLWDQLTSEQVVSLVGGHLAGLKGEVPKLKLLDLVRTSSGSPTVEGKDKKQDEALEGAWTFVDENVSTHLIRNALGGADEQRLRRLLSIPAPHSRSRRDDITVTVLWWEEGKEDVAKVGTTTIPPLAKAKL